MARLGRNYSCGSRTDLHVQSVTMTDHIYRDVIQEQNVRLFWGTMGAEFLFMDDNARPHHANIVDECLQSEDIILLWYLLIYSAAVAEWYRYRNVACFVTSSSPVPLKTRRVGQRCTLNLSRAETSSRWCGVVVREGGASSGVVHVT
ncbi:uncharacterized protein TNCV_1663131 [Trichonephila clavipes]|nr:uncharacterized protein TNCV_1663131 [Trichonephila clavipes]